MMNDVSSVANFSFGCAVVEEKPKEAAKFHPAMQRRQRRSPMCSNWEDNSHRWLHQVETCMTHHLP